MSSKYIDDANYATSGFALTGQYASITIGTKGIIGGPGLGPAANITPQPFTITNSGTVTGAQTAIFLVGGLVTNAGTAAFIVGGTGIESAAGPQTIDNSGTIEGTGVPTLGAELGFGIDISNQGSITNACGGLIEANGAKATAISSYGLVLTNAGTIQALNSGYALAGKDSDITNNGQIIAGTTAINFKSVRVTNAAGALIAGYSGTAIQGYDLNAYNFGTIDGGKTGVSASHGVITNRGTIEGGNQGVYFVFGSITNSGITSLIEGTYAVAGRSITVENSGAIRSDAAKGGAAVSAVSGTIDNIPGGLIVAKGTGGVGIDLFYDGNIINAGTIEGGDAGDGVASAGGYVVNSGLIIGGNSGVFEGDGDISNEAGGTIIGLTGAGISSSKDRVFAGTNAGLIEGATVGVLDEVGYASEFTNTGTVTANGNDGIGCKMVNGQEGGSIVNSGTILSTGSGGIGIFTIEDWQVRNIGPSALIEAAVGVDLIEGANNYLINSGRIIGIGPAGAGAEVESFALNSGSIIATGSAGAGIRLSYSGTIVNGAAGLIEGATGIVVTNNISMGTINNFGTVIGSGHGGIDGTGVYLSAGGTLTNNGSASRIEGYWGVAARGLVGNINNGGSIDGTGKYGVGLDAGGVLDNARSGEISGNIGVALYGLGTITNFGTIASNSGTSGIAVKLNAASEVFVDEAGSVLVGMVEGHCGTLELAGTGATLTGLGTAFTDFGSVDAAAAADWTLTGGDAVPGNLEIAGPGTLDIDGTISGSGALTLGGTETILSGGVLTLADLTQSGGSLTLAKDVTYRGGFVQTGGPIHVAGHTLVLDGVDILEGGAVNGAGFLATYGTVALTAYTVNAGAVWQVYGTVDALGYLTLGNGGSGSGRLAIVEDGVFDITGTGGVVIAPGGGGTLVNYALLEKTGGSGISIIQPALVNSGTLKVTSGTLDFEGAVSGTGCGTIGSGGALRFDSSVAATQAIDFAGTTGGRLVLNDPSGNGLGFAGTVTGFGGKDEIDIPTIAFSGNPSLGWSQNGSSGTLTVTDGSKIVKLTLFGQYMQSGFGKTLETGGGTIISYTTPAQQAATLATTHHG